MKERKQEDMKKKTIAGLTAIVAIAAVVIFAGCVEKEGTAPTPMQTTPITTPEPTVTPTPILTPSPIPTSTTTPTPAITITALEDGDKVSWREFVEGTSEGVYGSELNIYVLIYPTDGGGPWWVQPDVDVLRDGSWETNCYFGREPPQDKSAHFRGRLYI